MKIIENSIKNRIIIIFLMFVLVAAGIFSYYKLGKLEDPEFKLKEALIVTLYPGASPEMVENEVTAKIENAAKKLPNVEISSISKAGYSEVSVKINEKIKSKYIEQYWDNLRKKINDVKLELPLGTTPSLVLDDYSDVYGMFFAITSDGFSREELYQYAKKIKKNLENIDGISKAVLFGGSDEVIEIEINKEKIKNMNINEKLIFSSFYSQNIPVNSSYLLHNNKNIRVDINQNFKSIEDIKNLIIFTSPKILNSNQKETVLLRDIAKVEKKELNPYSIRMRYNGEMSIGLMLSPISGTNIVKTGKEIEETLEEIKEELPHGIEIKKVYYQPELVEKAISQFVGNLIMSVIVVVGVLLISMGIRSGMIIGSGLILSILGTLIFMFIFKIDLQRVSLGAFIIAMGMLVDNSIVVVDGVLNYLENGENKYDALVEPTKKTAIPLLGATFIAIVAFLPMYLMPTAAGEYVGSAFWIIAISLGLSWIISLTQTTVFCDMYLEEKNIKKNNSKTKILNKFKEILAFILEKRLVSLFSIIFIFLLVMLLFIKLPISFFPDSDKKGFVINIWNPVGTDIEISDKITTQIENELLKEKNIKNITATVGSSTPRYYIASIPELPDSSFSQLIINVNSIKDIDKIWGKITKYVNENFPDTRIELRKYINGIPNKYPIQLRIKGKNENLLRKYAEEIESILKSVEGTVNINTDWREKVLVLKPKLDIIKQKDNLITNADVAISINRALNGFRVGTFREGEEDIPVLFKEENSNRNIGIDNFKQISIRGLGINSLSLSSLEKEENLIWENPIIIRKDGIKAIQVQSDILRGYNTETVRKNFQKKIKNIKLAKGYKLEWSGEYYEQKKNIEIISSYVPFQLLIMVMISVFLFKSLRDTFIIFIVLPLSFIGIIPGLLILGKSFGFMSIVGAISLNGMMIKSSIVLLDEIKYQINVLKKDPFYALIDASTSRVRAVSLAAGTTIFGMIPLIFDPLYSDMAISIIFGLSVSTILILFIVPLLYAILYKIEKNK